MLQIVIAFANLISSRIIWRPRNDGWLCAHAPGSRAEPAWTGLGGQGPPLPMGGLSHPHLGGRARQPGPLLASPIAAALGLWCWPSRESPGWPGSHHQEPHPLWAGLAPEALARTSAVWMPAPSWSFLEQREVGRTGNGSLRVCSFLPLILD